MMCNKLYSGFTVAFAVIRVREVTMKVSCISSIQPNNTIISHEYIRHRKSLCIRVLYNNTCCVHIASEGYI